MLTSGMVPTLVGLLRSKGLPLSQGSVWAHGSRPFTSPSLTLWGAVYWPRMFFSWFLLILALQGSVDILAHPEKVH